MANIGVLKLVALDPSLQITPVAACDSFEARALKGVLSAKTTLSYETVTFLIPADGDAPQTYFINIPSQCIDSYKLQLLNNILDYKRMNCENILNAVRRDRFSSTEMTQIDLPDLLLCTLSGRIDGIELIVTLNGTTTTEHPTLFVNYGYFGRSKRNELLSRDVIVRPMEHHHMLKYTLANNEDAEHMITLPFTDMVKGLLVHSNYELATLSLIYYELATVGMIYNSFESVRDANYYLSVTPYLNNLNVCEKMYYIPVGANMERLDDVKLVVKCKHKTEDALKLDIIAITTNALVYSEGVVSLWKIPDFLK